MRGRWRWSSSCYNSRGNPLIEEVRTRVRKRDWKQAVRGMLALLRQYPRGFALLSERRVGQRNLDRELQVRKQQVEKFRSELAKERQRAERLRERNQRLTLQTQNLTRQMRNARSPEQGERYPPMSLEAKAKNREFRSKLLQGLLRDSYEFHDNNVDFWRFQTSRAHRFKIRIKDKILLFARTKGFVRRNFAIKKATKRLMYVLENLDSLEDFYHLLRGDYSKQLLIELLKFRILGEKHVRLPLNDKKYWDKRRSIDKTYLKKRQTLRVGAPLNWYLNHYQLQGLSGTLNMHAHSLNILNTFMLEQYAYQKGTSTIRVQSGDVVIDGGGGWGDTALDFADKTGSKGKVYCFEFVPDNLEILRRNISLNQHLANSIKVVPKALWEKSGEIVEYSVKGPGTSLADNNEQGTLQVSTLSIDDLVEQEGMTRVDYIKLDIEGSELRALQGAEKTIRTFRPKLAIALYHKKEDFVVIPDYLNKLSLQYELFLDHFSIHEEETVLFASPKS